MTNYQTGHQAEQVVAEYLKDQGYSVLSLNWSTPQCEIDIVASKGEVIYFVEVKYRKNQEQGTGLDYITPAKLQQMQYAATIWALENDYDGDYELSAIELTANFEVKEFLPTLT